MSKTKELATFVVPSYNEEKNVPLVHEDILAFIDLKKYDYEMIFVNDGSKDKTWESITKLARHDPKVHGISFSRNFGHHAALEAGLKEARGDVVVMMDGDLQHPASLLPQLFALYEEGYDIVNTVRESTEKVGFFKKITGAAFYKVINTISDLRLNTGEADFRLVNRKALDVLNGLPESPKFYRGLVNWIGFKVARVPYRAEARRFGKSSYTFKKMIELARLGLTSFSMKPLKFIIYFGSTLSLVSFLALCAMLTTKWFFDPVYFGNTTILVTFSIFVTGLLSTFQGITAIYLVDIFNASKNRPTFIVGEKL